MAIRASIVRRTPVTGALVAGASLGAAGIASAATGSTTSGSTTSTASSSTASTPWSTGSRPSPPLGASINPATVSHGPGETLLTGSALQKAEAAAKAAVPGATVVRAETDSSGAAP